MLLRSMMRCIPAMVAGVLCAASVMDASAQCMRLVRDAQRMPDMDGPGVFGPLAGVLTLDCLKFEGTKQDKRGMVAMLVDERGKPYEVHVGDEVGENGGRVMEVTEKRITVSQLVLGKDGEWVETTRYVFRAPEKQKVKK